MRYIFTRASSESKRQLMHHMGRLWLRAEVRELERAVRKREGACTFSPYIVVDAEALLHHAALVKQLVFSRKFVVIIPCVVVGALDELKRDSVKARDATRWLETQFQRGNRFLRAQRAGERLSLPLIKLPKKKDKEAWTFFQVLECCAHLARQSSAGASTATLVTLLTGSDLAASRDFSPSGLAQSAGIKLESITSFCGKWKQGTSKSQGT
ncbi:hypothetical protein B566_EDAN003514 [Ephemera danica]|nr:hypothetical protein B566_EDAN003514 [Ephemera danica]